MSDYMSIKDDRFWQILFDEACVEGKQAERIQKELEQITVGEKEIIRKVFERVVERLEEEKDFFKHDELDYGIGSYRAFGKSIQVIKEEGGIE